MQLRVIVLTLAAGLICAAAPPKISVEQLKGFVNSSIQRHLPDKEVAEYLHKIQISEQLDARTVEELQGLGAGPKTLAALNDLRESSATLPKAAPPPPPPVYVPPPPPNSIEQKRVLEEATDYARNYSTRMPDFICMQRTHRYFDPKGGEDWRGADTIVERLTYFEHKENYTVSLINGRAVTNVKHEQLGGTTASGEFASMMEEIFAAKSDTQFDWDRWGKLRGHVTHVFAYKVPQSTSNYHLLAQGAEAILVGYHGLVFVDKETSRIMKITLEADNIPSDYPVKSASLSLDYSDVDIAGNHFLLPFKSIVTLKAAKNQNTKNEADFTNYRKFSAESVIKDLDPEPIPDSAIKEQPVQKKK